VIGEARRRHPDLHDQDFSIAMFVDLTTEIRCPDDHRTNVSASGLIL
jgi:hypothetical protein